MVKMHKLFSKYSSAYSAANCKQVCDKCIWTLPTKQMQHLAVDSCGPDLAAPANTTFSDMFCQLTEAAVLAECAGSVLTSFKCSKKSARKLPEADLEPEKKAQPEKAAETACTQPSGQDLGQNLLKLGRFGAMVRAADGDLVRLGG